MVDLATELVNEGDDLLDQSDYVGGVYSEDGVEAKTGFNAGDQRYNEAVDSLMQLADEKYEKALKVLEKLDKELPAVNVPYDESSLFEAQLYIRLGQNDSTIAEKARPILDGLWKRSTQYLTYYESFKDEVMKDYNSECDMHFQFLSYIRSFYATIDSKKAEALEEQQMDLLKKFISKGGQLKQR